jgi:hypothetical protein
LKLKATYTPLENALKRSWEGFSKKQTKETNPSLVFALLGAFAINIDFLLIAWNDQRFGNLNHEIMDSSLNR